MLRTQKGTRIQGSTHKGFRAEGSADSSGRVQGAVCPLLPQSTHS